MSYHTLHYAMDPDLVINYLKGDTIEFRYSDASPWTPVLPYTDPSDIARISNKHLLFRAIRAVTIKYYAVDTFGCLTTCSSDEAQVKVILDKNTLQKLSIELC